MVADLVMKQDMADVTIYGNVCEYCREGFETIDSLVRHQVNEHDELWNYEKVAEESLKRIKLDKKVLKDLIRSKNTIKEGGSINCKFCKKCLFKSFLLLTNFTLYCI